MMAKKAHRHGKKVVFHAHTTEEDFRDSFVFSNNVSGIFKKWLITVYSQGDELITPTQYSKRLLDGYEICRPIHAISNGIDLEAFHKNKAQGKRFRESLGYKDTDQIVLSVGLTIKRKGIVDFIEIARQMPKVQFVWCGHTAPSLIPKPIKTAIEEAPENVHFLGYIDDLKGAYYGSDVFFMPSYEENEGIVVLEALSSKIPVIVRDIPVFDDWMEDGIHCYKASTNDGFAKLLQQVMDHALPDTTEEGYKVVEGRTLFKVGKALGEVYETILGGDSNDL
jgi:1,2-diacylglycerol-3-alpha-glucose alpha-1,2-glucosyltransferase